MTEVLSEVRLAPYGECGECIVKRNIGRNGKGLAPCRSCQLEAENEALRHRVQALETAALRLTERVRNCLPPLGAGIIPNRETLERVEVLVGELEQALAAAQGKEEGK